MITEDAILLREYVERTDAQVFAELVRRYAGLVFGVCFRITRNAQDSEDLSQECFVELAKKAGSIDTSLGGWLHRVAKCKAINVVKSRVTRQKWEDAAMQDPSREANIAETREFDWSEVSPYVDEALDSLPDELRDILIRHYLQGEPQTHLARIFNVNQSTISRLLEKGVELLRGKLQEERVIVPSVSLGLLLAAHGAVTAPQSLMAGLGKLAMVGVSGTTRCGTSPRHGTYGSAAKSGLVFKAGVAIVLAGAAALGVLFVAGNGKGVQSGKGKLLAAVAGNGGDKMPLGSPGFMPSPERPLGWRGDNSGRYPGSAPGVVEWYRRVSCLSYDLRSQAAKPKNGETGEPVISQFPFRYRAITEWLITGPITPKEGASIEDELVAGEANMKPDAGDKVASVSSGQTPSTWVRWKGKPWLLEGWGRSTPPSSKESIMPDLKKDKDARTASVATMPETQVGFSEVCAAAKGPVAAYAHAYIYAPRDGDIGFLTKAKADLRMWMNGKVIYSRLAKGMASGDHDTDKVEVKQGWNSLLCKMIAPSLEKMELDVCVWPNYEDLKYEAKNILWMTPLAGSSPQSPLIFGGRIYLNTDNNELICMDLDGKAQWLKTTHMWYSVSDEEKKVNPAFKEKVEPLILKLEETEKQIVAEMNAWREANTPTSKVLVGKVSSLSAQKSQFWRQAEKEMQAIDAKKYCGGRVYGGSGSGGAGSFAVCTDGKYLCDFYASAFASCYDMNGNRKWTRGVDPELRPHGPEHGNNSSGVIADGKYIVFYANKFTAFDLETGKVVWTQKGSGTYQSLVLAKIGGTQVVIDPDFRNIVAAKDGKVLWTGGAFNSYAPTAVIDDGVVYAMGGPNIKGPLAVRLPGSTEELKNDLKPLYRFDKAAFGVPSPLVHGGLLYGSDIYASLSVGDIKDGKLVYRKQIDLHHYQHLRDGVYCSTTLGGKYIYQTDNNASTIVIEPGRELKVVARNSLDYAQPPRYGTASIFDSSGASGCGPVFHGDKTYFRSRHFLYCIGEK